MQKVQGDSISYRKGDEEFLLWLRGLRNLLVPMRMWIWSLALISGLRIQCSSKLQWGSQTQLDLALLWHKQAAAALIWLIAWELPYAARMAFLKKKENGPLQCEYFYLEGGIYLLVALLWCFFFFFFFFFFFNHSSIFFLTSFSQSRLDPHYCICFFKTFFFFSF